MDSKKAVLSSAAVDVSELMLAPSVSSITVLNDDVIRSLELSVVSNDSDVSAKRDD